jgi:hypothetical protein
MLVGESGCRSWLSGWTFPSKILNARTPTLLFAPILCADVTG